MFLKEPLAAFFMILAYSVRAAGLVNTHPLTYSMKGFAYAAATPAGGIFAINIGATKQIIWNTFGFGG